MRVQRIGGMAVFLLALGTLAISWSSNAAPPETNSNALPERILYDKVPAERNRPGERFLYDSLIHYEPDVRIERPSTQGPDSTIELLADRDIEKEFIGNWRLVSYETFSEDGSVTPRQMIGRIMYDGDGNMAAQLMPVGDRQQVENGRIQGYVAYFGKYEVDSEEGRVIHRPEASTFARWVGGELIRYYEFEDDLLKLSLRTNGRVTGTLTWERLD